LEEHLYGSSQKTNSLGQQVNRTQNMSTWQSKEKLVEYLTHFIHK
jgi:hypothetical protein